MSREEAIQRLNACRTGDIEYDHEEADGVLCDLLRSLGYDDVVDVWVSVDKWYA